MTPPSDADVFARVVVISAEASAGVIVALRARK
jgi:hypothetical protein